QAQQRLALEQLHHDERQAMGLAGLVGLHDVRIAQLDQYLALAAEPRDEVRIGGELAVHDLERDLAIDIELLRAIDRAEPADRDPALDLVAQVDQEADERIVDGAATRRAERGPRIERR